MCALCGNRTESASFSSECTCRLKLIFLNESREMPRSLRLRLQHICETTTYYVRQSNMPTILLCERFFRNYRQNERFAVRPFRPMMTSPKCRGTTICSCYTCMFNRKISSILSQLWITIMFSKDRNGGKSVLPLEGVRHPKWRHQLVGRLSFPNRVQYVRTSD